MNSSSITLYLDMLGDDVEFAVNFNNIDGELKITKIHCEDCNIDMSALLKCKIHYGYINRVLLETLAEDGV